MVNCEKTDVPLVQVASITDAGNVLKSLVAQQRKSAWPSILVRRLYSIGFFLKCGAGLV